MKLSDFDYKLPKELIAQNPAKPRDHSRLLVLDRKNRKIEHKHFYNIIDYLKSDDVLVLNNSKVFPARLFGRRVDTGGKVEILLNKNISIIPAPMSYRSEHLIEIQNSESSSLEVVGKNLKPKSKIIFEGSKLKAMVIDKKDTIATVEFNITGNEFFTEIEKIGHTPLPPYIGKNDTKKDKINYQTVYAQNCGSVAAPTAGLHFTKELLRKIKMKNIEIAKVTLHVGLGTFAPVEEKNIEDHKIHSEYYIVIQSELDKIIKAKNEGRRIIAVGTTSTRVLETIFSKYDPPAGGRNTIYNISGWAEIFIYPGYKFKCIDGLITNFHLPKTTLLMLVSAFAGKKNINRVYQEAIKQKYRFYSYGDAMLII